MKSQNELLKALATIKAHIEQTNTDFIYNGMIVPKCDVLQYIDLVVKDHEQTIWLPSLGGAKMTDSDGVLYLGTKPVDECDDYTFNGISQADYDLVYNTFKYDLMGNPESKFSKTGERWYVSVSGQIDENAEENEKIRIGVPAIHEKIRLTDSWQVIGAFTAPMGATGTVVAHDDELREITVLMDEHIEGCEEWNNNIYFHYEDCRVMIKKTSSDEINGEKFLQKLKAFATASRELSAAWEDIQDGTGNAGYPFPASFDEINAEIQNWCYEQQK